MNSPSFMKPQSPHTRSGCLRGEVCCSCDSICRPGGPNVYHSGPCDGMVKITEYNVFPGIWLAYKEVDSFRFDYPASYPEDILEVNYCLEGRLEYEDHVHFFFLGPGDLSIHRSTPDGAVLRCPTKHYRGLSVMVDPCQAPQCTACLLSDVNVQLPELYHKFCGGKRHFIMRSTPQLESIFSQLWHVPEHIRTGYYKVKLLELLLFLSCLEPEMSQWEEHGCTAAQRMLAREVIAYVDVHRGEHLTAAKLAAALHASPEQLRRSVKQVYGKSLYQCVRAYKMRLAAKLLRETERTVSDIAGEFGYDNSSKFACAFQSILGIPPGEYRVSGPPSGTPLLILE